MKKNFNDGWLFHQGELEQPVAKVTDKAGTCGGPSNLTEEEGYIYKLHPYMAKKMRIENGNHLYNVAKRLEGNWQSVSLPHDWSVNLDYLSPEQNGGKAVERGYLPAGCGYYRKRFSMPAKAEGKRILIEFEGVMRNSVVWINGCYIGTHSSGYTGFAYDISEYLFYGEEGENVILVKADTEEKEGWWAEGAGIYRNVWLLQKEEIHIRRNGIFVFCENVSEKAADVIVKTVVESEAEQECAITVRQRLLLADGTQVSVTEQILEPGKMGGVESKMEEADSSESELRFRVAQPCLWNLEQPYLYTMATELEVGGRIVDEMQTCFGIRDVRYTQEGLQLNGKRVEIKGVCVHQDFAGVGTALTEDIIKYRLTKIKEMGANAYRSAHHPASEDLLSACDRMGILVLNENRGFGCSGENFSELRELIEGSRNHPCIFMWSLENEELISTLPNGKRILKRLVKYAHKLDATRQCTVAGHYACRDEEYVKIPDVAGFNYDMDDAQAMRRMLPELLTIASEDGSFVSARGVYQDDREKGICDSYDSGSYMIKMMMEQMGLKELPAGTLGGASSPNDLTYSWNHYHQKAAFLGGMFVWSAFDYRGETFPWNWPAVRSQYGAMDMCGFEKDAFYYWKSLWTKEPMVHLLPHWNLEVKNGDEVQVDVYSNCGKVELFLNGRSLGTKEHEKGGISSWKIAYEPGEIVAAAYYGCTASVRQTDAGAREVVTDRRITAGKPEKVRLSKLYDGEKDCIFKAEIVDRDGSLCPTAENRVTFSVTGGYVKGTGNGNPADHEPESAADRKAFGGCVMALIEKGEGSLEVSASMG